VNIGSASGNSTVNFNGNRLQGVAAGVNGTDAVNMNQYNALQNSMNTNFNQLKYGVAGVAAAANIPGLNKDQDFNIGLGGGSYQGYSAMAIGANVRIYDNISMKATGSTGGGQTSGGLGVAIGW
jgi:autotransporter adhesin